MQELKQEVYGRKLINLNQIGFMKYQGTDLNLGKWTSGVLRMKMANQKEIIFILSLNLKAEYDCVHHYILLEKLEKFGIRPDSIERVRKIYSAARINLSSTSEVILVNKGVLQGSIISPILLNLHQCPEKGTWKNRLRRYGICA
jgi:hypothetical protein